MSANSTILDLKFIKLGGKRTSIGMRYCGYRSLVQTRVDMFTSSIHLIIPKYG